MTAEELAKAIMDRKLPKDELSNYWDLGLGMAPVSMLFFGAILMVLDQSNPISTKTELKILFVTGLLFTIAIYFLLVDRKLKPIVTERSKEENRILVIETLKKIDWGYQEDSLGIFHVDIPFIFGQTGHHLKIMVLDNEILFNIRNVGTSKGRMPFLFGIDTLKELKLKFEFQRTMNSRVIF